MKIISEKIKYLPSTNNPLSADVYFIDGNEYCYIYDVGNNEYSLSKINKINKDKVVILSHYHRDHIGNINKINYHKLYVGELTYRTIGEDIIDKHSSIIVEDKFTIQDGVKIEVIHCASPHVDGSLIVNIDSEYTLIADLYLLDHLSIR